MTRLLADAVYIRATAAVQPEWPDVGWIWRLPAMLRTASGVLKRVAAGPILPYTSLFEANLVAAMVNDDHLTPPDPFSSEWPFSDVWPTK